MQHDILRKKLNFDILTPRVGRGTTGKRFATMLMHFLYSIKFYMQHDHVLNTLNFKLLTTSSGPGVSAGITFATMLLHS